MQTNGIEMYDPSIGRKYLDSLPEKKIQERSFPMWLRSVRILDGVLCNEKVPGRQKCKIIEELSGPFAEYAYSFLDELKTMHRSGETINRYQIIIDRFLSFLQHENIVKQECIKESVVFQFIDCQETRKTEISYILKRMFRFWQDNGIISHDLTSCFFAYKMKHHQRVLSFYSQEEIAIIESSVDRSNPLGKRNYALLLLATRLGMRTSDIANLKITDIDWRKNEIIVVQYKTKSPADFPLLSIVGNAIIDYMKYGRPSFISSPHIFHSFRPPYQVMNSSMVSSAITSVIEGCGIDLKGRRHGAHSMRHSLATNLLRKETSLPVISEILGHKHTQTTTIYLSIDIPSLMECSIDVPPVSTTFYNKKGGKENE
jgi:site-specific recombinase XerD